MIHLSFTCSQFRNIHLNSLEEGEFESGTDKVYIYVFIFIALLILVVACVKLHEPFHGKINYEGKRGSPEKGHGSQSPTDDPAVPIRIGSL